jgi:NAD/NADP transhydrogenase alpha subunit
MLVGVPKEIKDHEYRVGLIPSTLRELVSKGHRVLVETGAGHGAGIGDDDYAALPGPRAQSRSETLVTINVRIVPSCSRNDTYSPGTRRCLSSLNPGSSSDERVGS